MPVPEWLRRQCSDREVPRALVVERAGVPVARLDDPQFLEMFWFTWRITPLVERPDVRAAAFWTMDDLPKTAFRCPETGEAATPPLWSMSDPICQGRLLLRGAYVPVYVPFRRHPLRWLKLFFLGGGAYDPPDPDPGSEPTSGEPDFAEGPGKEPPGWK